jgi:hypothetical protein
MKTEFYACVETYGPRGGVCCPYVSQQLPPPYVPCAGAYKTREEAYQNAYLLWKLLRQGEIMRRNAVTPKEDWL